MVEGELESAVKDDQSSGCEGDGDGDAPSEDLPSEADEPTDAPDVANARIERGAVRDRFMRRTFANGISEDLVEKILDIFKVDMVVVPKSLGFHTGVVYGVLKRNAGYHLLSNTRLAATT